MILQALSELRPNCNVEVRYNNDGSYEILSYKHSEPQPTEKELNDKVAELQAEYDSNQYQRDRAVAFPSWQEQLDMQYWDKVNGTNKWQETVAKVKADNPKPE